jgi:hypothetical protein
MNADPVTFLQLMQWQMRNANGSPTTSYCTSLHRHDPVLTVFFSGPRSLAIVDDALGEGDSDVASRGISSSD